MVTACIPGTNDAPLLLAVQALEDGGCTVHHAQTVSVRCHGLESRIVWDGNGGLTQGIRCQAVQGVPVVAGRQQALGLQSRGKARESLEAPMARGVALRRSRMHGSGSHPPEEGTRAHSACG